MKTVFHLLAEEDGTTVPEYALIAGIITFAALAAMLALGVKFLTLFAF